MESILGREECEGGYGRVRNMVSQWMGNIDGFKDCREQSSVSYRDGK